MVALWWCDLPFFKFFQLFFRRGLSMKTFFKLVCHLLILSMIWLPIAGRAAMVSTGEVVAGASDQMNRDKVLEFAARADVQKTFESLGLTAANAQDRVNAMTQEEVNRIAGRIDSMPAGASDGWWWAVAVIAIAGAIWYFYK
jgi:hypothetical protein